MSEPEPEMKATRQPGELNETQQRRLLVTCQYIDKLLSDIEHALHSATSQSPFPRYVMDITPTQAASLEDHIPSFALNCCAHWHGNTWSQTSRRFR